MELCGAALETPGVGEAFSAVTLAIGAKDRTRLGKLFALAEALPEARRGLTSAFGWVSAHDLEGTVAELLAAKEPVRREVGIATRTMHRLDPGVMLADAIDDPDPRLRARALRAAGEIGRRDLYQRCRERLKDEDPTARFHAAASAFVLGDRDRSLSVLEGLAIRPSPCREDALRRWLMSVDRPSGHRLLMAIAQQPADRRLLIEGAGVVGDPQLLPWLIGLMTDDTVARLAGESFSMITGLDLAYLDLERKPPEDFEPGPTDDAADPNVDMDADESLPWPNQTRIQACWEANRHSY